MIHADQAKPFDHAVEHRRKDAARSAHRAECHQYGLAAYRVTHLMMVADELHGISARVAVDVDANHQSVLLDPVSARRRHRESVWHEKHVVGRHDHIRRIQHSASQQQSQWNDPSAPTRRPPRG